MAKCNLQVSFNFCLFVSYSNKTQLIYNIASHKGEKNSFTYKLQDVVDLLMWFQTLAKAFGVVLPLSNLVPYKWSPA